MKNKINLIIIICTLILFYCGFQFISEYQHSRYDIDNYNCKDSSYEIGFLIKVITKLPVYVIHGRSYETRTYYDDYFKTNITVHWRHCWINIFGLNINSVDLKPFILTSPFTEYEETKRVRI